MSRLPPIDPATYTEPQHALAASLATRPEVVAHGIVGPFAAMMHAPEMGADLTALGARIRFGASLPANATEVAICTAGAFYRAKFEFAAHRAMALRAGVDEGALDRLAGGDDPGFEGDEAAAHAVASELLRDHGISEATYQGAEARFGPQGMVELVTTIGYYTLVSMMLNGFEIGLAPGMADPFPDDGPRKPPVVS